MAIVVNHSLNHLHAALHANLHVKPLNLLLNLPLNHLHVDLHAKVRVLLALLPVLRAPLPLPLPLRTKPRAPIGQPFARRPCCRRSRGSGESSAASVSGSVKSWNAAL